jgi:molybdopterin/thiamine biosynthesis adenylyltransferase
MNDAQLRRYSRHLLLPEIDIAGQEKLLQSKVLLIGLGGLGSPVAMYLAASGVGSLVLCDHDVVELSNLQRQILHKNKDVSRSKALSAAETVLALNPDVSVIAIPTKLEGLNLTDEVAKANLVIDATDNFHARHALNAACVSQKTPLISGSVIRMAGQITSFRFDRTPSPCYHCLYPAEGKEQETCAQSGVLAPLAGVIGSLQAIEALKILLNFGEALQGRLLQLDAITMTWRTSTLKGDPDCPICSPQAHKLSPLEYQAVSR